MKMDDTDRSLLKLLKQNSRLSMAELGRRVNLSSPSVAERVKRMESFGLIKNIRLKSIMRN